MEVLIGLVILIGSVVWLIKFNKTTTSIARGAESKAQGWAEEMMQEATIERVERYEQFVKDTTVDGKRKQIISHDSFMAEMEGK